MTDFNEGDTWYCPISKWNSPCRRPSIRGGMDVYEIDQIALPIKLKDGQTVRVPHEQFGGGKATSGGNYQRTIQ